MMPHLLLRFVKTIAASCLVVLLLTVLLGILSKRMGLSITWTIELAKFLLAWTVMFGGALAYFEHSHLGVDILVSKTDNQGQRVSYILKHALVGIFALLVMVIGGYQLFQTRWESEQILPVLGIRKAWFYLAVPVSGVLIFIASLAFLFQGSNLQKDAS